jgi:hypothetical protein
MFLLQIPNNLNEGLPNNPPLVTALIVLLPRNAR